MALVVFSMVLVGFPQGFLLCLFFFFSRIPCGSL